MLSSQPLSGPAFAHSSSHWRLVQTDQPLTSSNQPPTSGRTLQVRNLNLHEYQGAELMKKHGIDVPQGTACTSHKDAEFAAKLLRE